MSEESDDTYAGLTRSEYPTLRANVMTYGGSVLTDEMLINGLKALKDIEDARRRKRIEMAPWLIEMQQVVFWLWDSGRKAEAEHCATIAAVVNKWGVTNQRSLDLLDGWVAEYRSRQ